jgi:hypothetical protein
MIEGVKAGRSAKSDVDALNEKGSLVEAIGPS